MKVTDVRVRPVSNPKYNTLGYADVTFDEIFVVKNFRIVRGKKGLFVGMPSKKGQDGQFYPEVFYLKATEDGSLGQAANNAFQQAVLKAWGQVDSSPEFSDQTKVSPQIQPPVTSDGYPF